MNRARPEVLVGLFVLAAFGVLMWGSLQLGLLRDLAGENGRRLIARFDDVSGLDEQARVLVAGVKVGYVEALELEGGAARVTLRIEEDSLEVPVDSLVALRSRGLLGERVVEIVPGESDQLLDADGVLTHTREAADIDLFVRRLSRVADDVQAISATFRNVLGTPEGEESLQEVLANTRALTADLRRIVDENEARLERVVISFETFSDDLATLTQENRESVAGLVENFRHASESLNASLDALARLSANLEQGEGTLGRLVASDDLYTDLDATLVEARAALREIRRAAEETQEQVPATILTTLLGSLF